VLPGAVLARVATGHLRVGSFQYASATGDIQLLRRLADHALRRYHPEALAGERPYLALFDAVVAAQARLVARWMLVGFIHGVMNTDNMTISGETIDYGPCAFMEAFDPTTVYSSIDEGGRYSYGNQPVVAQWNLARLAEALLPLVDDDPETAVAAATGALQTFPERFQRYWSAGMHEKLGLTEADEVTGALIDDLLTLLHEQAVDYTSALRALSAWLRGDGAAARSLFPDAVAVDTWAARWREQLAQAASDPHRVASAMDRVNPIYIPRNHHVEQALATATAGDLEPFQRLLDVLARPFDERPGLESYAAPAPSGWGSSYRTFCGT
jgi:protein adenylyltransferase